MPLGEPVDSGHLSRGTTRTPYPRFDHLRRMTGRYGIWEHAEYSTPRTDHGFCTEDNARALVVVARQGAGLSDLASMYLECVLEARTQSGHFRNRRNAAGVWTDEVGSDDSQGRAWWGLGSVARFGPEEWMRRAGVESFETSSVFQSPHLRANAYAALGAAEMAKSEGDSACALDLLDRTTAVIAEAARTTVPWPETRLTYDNARLPEALIAAGDVLGDDRRLSRGIRLLEWLVEEERNGSHFSFTAVGGRHPGGPQPAFDQQPLEAWAMADACHRAWSITGDSKWRVRAMAAVFWLLGRNDTGSILYDESTGATGDGLMIRSANANCGAESTIAGLGVLQVALSVAGHDGMVKLD